MSRCLKIRTSLTVMCGVVAAVGWAFGDNNGELVNLAVKTAAREAVLKAIDIEYQLESWTGLPPGSVTPPGDCDGRRAVIRIVFARCPSTGEPQAMVADLNPSDTTRGTFAYYRDGLVYTYRTLKAGGHTEDHVTIDRGSLDEVLNADQVLRFLPYSAFPNALGNILQRSSTRTLGRNSEGLLRVLIDRGKSRKPDPYELLFNTETAVVEKVELHLLGRLYNSYEVARWSEPLVDGCRWPLEIVFVGRREGTWIVSRFTGRHLKMNDEVDLSSLTIVLPKGTLVDDRVTGDTYVVE